MAPNPIRWIRFARAHRWTQRHVSDYLDGDLDQRERERAERHIHECPECTELLKALRSIVGSLGRIRGRPRREVAATVLAGVRERLAAGDDERAD